MNKYVLLFLTIITFIGCSTMPNKTLLKNLVNNAPVAKKVSYYHQEYGNKRFDPYHWLRDDERKDPEIIDYLNQENAYTDAILKEQKPLIDELYKEIVARLPQKEQSVPYQIDNYWYYSRFAEGKEYPIYARKDNSLDNAEQITVDMNQRAVGHSYFQSNYQAISPNHKIIGFSEDITGRRKYSLHFKNLSTGEMYADVIENTTGAIVWALDNKTFFYTKKHPTTLLPYRVYRHELGTDNNADELVYEEKDNTFYTSISASRSKNYIFIDVGSTTNTEVYVLDAKNPRGEFRSFLKREKDHEYSVEEIDDKFYILSNWQAKNFRVLQTDLAHSQDKSYWQEVMPHDSQTLIYEVEAFRDFLVINQRKEGIRHIKLYNFATKSQSIIDSNEDAYTMYIGYNPQQNTDTLRYAYASMTTPMTVYDYDMTTGKQVLKKRDEVVGGYDDSQFKSLRTTITARDGAQVPVSLVYKKSDTPLSERPLLVYAYGSYGSSVDPTFSYSRLSLLNRGFVFAIAHIRGSQAKGRAWYEDGKLLHKKNTFTDFVDATKGIVAQGYGNKNKVFAMGGSAGGLLMGAVVNMNAELYKGVVAAVPFVDVISTMLDESIPLTTGEFDEWGNPKIKKYYDYMLSYSPYDQVSKKAYPNMLITTGLHDSQVQYWEPAKWLAKLRDMKTDDNILIMRTNMEAGHGGASGRFQRFKETAEEYGFILKILNAKN